MPSAPAGRHVDAITFGRRWKLRRDVLIFVAAEAGFSHRWIADVFDLSRARVRQIVRVMRAKSSRGDFSESPWIQAAKAAFERLKSSSPPASAL
jgi:hypothetical protein